MYKFPFDISIRLKSCEFKTKAQHHRLPLCCEWDMFTINFNRTNDKCLPYFPVITNEMDKSLTMVELHCRIISNCKRWKSVKKIILFADNAAALVMIMLMIMIVITVMLCVIPKNWLAKRL